MKCIEQHVQRPWPPPSQSWAAVLKRYFSVWARLTQSQFPTHTHKLASSLLCVQYVRRLYLNVCWCVTVSVCVVTLNRNPASSLLSSVCQFGWLQYSSLSLSLSFRSNQITYIGRAETYIANAGAYRRLLPLSLSVSHWQLKTTYSPGPDIRKKEVQGIQVGKHTQCWMNGECWRSEGLKLLYMIKQVYDIVRSEE